MLTTIRRTTFAMLQKSGIVRLVADSEWRRQRLLILCYHGVAQEDEHLWRPNLYMTTEVFEQRLEIIRRGGYNVLQLGRALAQLRAGTLPPRSVVITFDDGMIDLYLRAYPLLKAYGFPFTVYQTTYYSDFQQPVFNLMCSYMLWKRRGEVVESGGELGITPSLDLRTDDSRQKVLLSLLRMADAENLSGAYKDELAAKLAGLLGFDYPELLRKRLFHLMNGQEISQLASEGVDFQLHTHRHRAPRNEAQFREEIQENRRRLEAHTKAPAVHFCYPSNDYRREFLPWLKAVGVVSATTCDPTLATVHTNPLLLPRLVDTSAGSALEFEAWLSGVGSFFAVKQAVKRAYKRRGIKV